MKRNILKKYNYILAFLLSVLGVGAACSLGGCEYGTPAEEYGVPMATFKIHGTVTSEENDKIPNIRVVLRTDTTYTDQNGAYAVQTNTFPDDEYFLVELDDIDGTANGAYQPLDTTVVFVDPQFVNGDGSWYAGETSKEVNIILKAGN